MDVIKRLQEQDEAALRLIMEQYGDMLLRTAYLMMKDRQAAEEAVQDTFIQAFRKIHQLEHPDKLQGWLIRIVVNRCRMKLRTWSWRSVFPFHRMEDVMEGAEPGAEELVLSGLRSESISRAIHRLDYKYREVLTLYYFNEWSVAEIAEQLAANENTVKARLARGRAQLKRHLDEEKEA